MDYKNLTDSVVYSQLFVSNENGKTASSAIKSGTSLINQPIQIVQMFATLLTRGSVHWGIHDGI